MILYAIKDKNSEKFWRDRKENGLELLTFDHCSVFTHRQDAEKLVRKHGSDNAELIEINLTTRTIPW